MRLFLFLLIGVTLTGPQLGLYQKQIVADLVQALAKAKVNVDLIQTVVVEFQSIRKNRGEG